MSDSKDIRLPVGFTELVPGPNPDFCADKIYLEASSPIMPAKHFSLDLADPARLEPLRSGQCLWSLPCSHAVTHAVQGSISVMYRGPSLWLCRFSLHYLYRHLE